MENDLIVTEKESRVIKMIAKTGFYIQDYNKKLGISKAIIETCLSKELIYGGDGVLIYRKFCQPYYLTHKGNSIAKNRYLINPYRSKYTQTEHDFILGNIYLSLSFIEQESWVTETTLNTIFQGMSVPDGMYTSLDKELVGIEVLTNNYSKLEKKNLSNFISKYCDKSIVLNSDKLKKEKIWINYN